MAAATLLCFAPACTKTVRVPEPAYPNLQIDKHSYLDVTTRDAHYRVSRFSMTDSTLVIEALTSNAYPSGDGRFDVPPELPYAVPWESIRSITRTRGPSSLDVALIAFFATVGLLAVLLNLFGGNQGWTLTQ